MIAAVATTQNTSHTKITGKPNSTGAALLKNGVPTRTPRNGRMASHRISDHQPRPRFHVHTPSQPRESPPSARYRPGPYLRFGRPDHVRVGPWIEPSRPP